MVGDVMLDRYLVGDAERLSPEAPVPIIKVGERRTALGGAANVAANVTAIGASCKLIGVVGDDSHGNLVRAELAAAGLDDTGIVGSANRPTTTKTRIVARGQQVVRIDEEIDTPLAGTELDRIREIALAEVTSTNVLLLQDYNKGVLGPELIEALIGAARNRGIPIVVDPKYRQFFAYAGATVFKPNRRELEMALGASVDLRQPEALPAALDRLKVDNMILTLGGDGMLVVTRDTPVSHIPSLAREVYDVSGAGDTVTAWVGTALAAGAGVREAALLGNFAAGVEVEKSGVATVSPEELLRAHEERHDQIGRLRRGGVI